MPQITLSAEVQPEQIVKRLDQTPAEKIPEYSRSRLKTWIEADLVNLNDRIANIPREKVLGGERIEIIVEVEDDTRFEPENIPLNIVYEDDDIIVINKTQRSCRTPWCWQSQWNCAQCTTVSLSVRLRKYLQQE